MISDDGVSIIDNDPSGKEFPWTGEPRLSDIIEIVGDSLVDHGNPVDVNSLTGKTFAVYFSAHWCPPCQGFTPLLITTYNNVKDQQKDFEVIFVSADKTQEEYDEYYGSMPWLSIHFDKKDAINGLSKLFNVRGIPTLLIFGEDGTLINPRGREAISNDPIGESFPWRQSFADASKEKAAAEQMGRQAVPLTTADVKLLNIGCEQMAYAAVKEYNCGRLDSHALAGLKAKFSAFSDIISALPRTSIAGGLPPAIEANRLIVSQPYPNCHLLQEKGMEKYAGDVSELTTPEVANMLDVPSSVSTNVEAIKAMVTCRRICEHMLARASSGSTTARLVLQYQIIALIGNLFTEVVPIPCPLDASEEEKKACVWSKDPLTQSFQVSCLATIHALTNIYSTVWQAIERPTRSFDSERSLVSYCMLAVFDFVIRQVCPLTKEKIAKRKEKRRQKRLQKEKQRQLKINNQKIKQAALLKEKQEKEKAEKEGQEEEGKGKEIEEKGEKVEGEEVVEEGKGKEIAEEKVEEKDTTKETEQQESEKEEKEEKEEKPEKPEKKGKEPTTRTPTLEEETIARRRKRISAECTPETSEILETSREGILNSHNNHSTNSNSTNTNNNNNSNNNNNNSSSLSNLSFSSLPQHSPPPEEINFTCFSWFNPWRWF